MDLLGDIGQADQLTTARAENAVLHEKVKTLTRQVQTLTLANCTLQAEVDLYRSDAAATGAATTAGASETATATSATTTVTSNALSMSNMSLRESSPNDPSAFAFLQTSGGGGGASSGYCGVPAYVFANVHQSVNPVCVALSEDATLLISGAANGELMVMQWEAVVARHSALLPPSSTLPSSTLPSKPMVIDFLRTSSAESLATTHPTHNNLAPFDRSQCATARLDAPVVSVASVTLRRTCTIVAAGLMDGRVVLFTIATERSAIPPTATRNECAAQFTLVPATTTTAAAAAAAPRHSKYVTAVTWGRTSDSRVLLITASADGLLNVSSVTVPLVLTDNDSNDNNDSDTPRLVVVQHLQSFHWDDAIPCLCFSRDCIYVYIRNTHHITCIHVPVCKTAANDDNEYTVTKLHLNAHALDDHVSFAVLSLQPSPPCKHDTVGGRYLAAATDHGRHIVLDTTTTSASIVKNLYGHEADGYSSPKIAWSRNGTWLYTNTQNESKLLVYDIASGQLNTVMAQQQQKSTPNDTTNESSNSNNSSSLKDKGAKGGVGGGVGDPHVRPIKDLFSSPCTNMVVTTSFDRNVVIWLPESSS